VVHLPGKELRKLVTEIPKLAIGLIEGPGRSRGKCLFGAGPDAWDAFDHRAALAPAFCIWWSCMGVKDPDGILIGATFTPR